MNFTFTSVLLRNPAEFRQVGVLEIHLFDGHYDILDGVKPKVCAQFWARRGRSAAKYRDSEQQARWVHNSSRDLPFPASCLCRALLSLQVVTEWELVRLPGFDSQLCHFRVLTLCVPPCSSSVKWGYEPAQPRGPAVAEPAGRRGRCAAGSAEPRGQPRALSAWEWLLPANVRGCKRRLLSLIRECVPRAQSHTSSLRRSRAGTRTFPPGALALGKKQGDMTSGSRWGEGGGGLEQQGHRGVVPPGAGVGLLVPGGDKKNLIVTEKSLAREEFRCRTPVRLRWGERLHVPV